MYMDLYVSLYIFALHVLGAVCTHPQEHKLQSTAIGMCNGYGMLIHWSRYWLGHPHNFSMVKFGHEHEETCRAKYRGIKNTYKPMYI